MSEELKPCPYCGSDNVGVNVSPVQADGLRYYYAICSQCKTAGPEVDNEEGEGISEEASTFAWNALPRPLRWTSEVPKVPGWYWVKTCPDESAIVFVETGQTTDEATSLSGIQWAGPIPEPQEPQP